jgi:hypothetical protein
MWKKIGKVEVIKYEEKENKEEWEYKEFGNNEYQADLFFIRISDRIKLIFNVIKKNNTYKARERCLTARKAMMEHYEVWDMEEIEELRHHLYMLKRK